jgi:serine/threonine-protein kinase
MTDFEMLKAKLTDFEQIARGGQKVVFRATHPEFGTVFVKLFFKTDARSQREIDISQGSKFDCIPIIYETGHVNYEGSDTFYVIEQQVDGEELRKRLDRGDRLTLNEAVDFLE